MVVRVSRCWLLRVFAAVGILGGFARGLFAQPTPLDSVEFQVNTYTTGYQREVTLAADSTGRFVVVWTSDGSFGSDSNAVSIQARRYDSDGLAPRDSEFQVNFYTLGNQDHPAAAAEPSGSLVLVWQSAESGGNDTSAESIQLRRFAPDGEPLDPEETQANVYTLSEQQRPDVAAGPAGDFVVVWESYGSFGSDQEGHSVQMRRFRGDGTPIDPQEVRVNTYTSGSEQRARIAEDAEGNFVVVWEADRSPQGPVGWDIWARRFNADGTPRDPTEFRVNTYTEGYQYRPAVAMDPRGNFVVTWYSETSLGNDDDSLSIQARRYGRDGAPLDPTEFQVNTYTTSWQYWPEVGMNAEGEFLVCWTSLGSSGSDSSSTSIQGRRFRPDGTGIDAQDIQLNAAATGQQTRAAVSLLPNGDFVVAWQSSYSEGTDQDGASVQARRFGRPTIVVTTASGGTGGPGCSLRDAITAANTGLATGDCPPGNRGAVVELPAGSEIALSEPDNGSNALPAIRTPVTIRGHGSRIERDPALGCPGTPELRLFQIDDGGILSLDDVSVANGCLSSGSGGAVLSNGGTLILGETSIEGNAAWGDGGGLAIRDGNLLMVDSTVRANLAAGAGGGVAISGDPGWLRVERSTVSGNVATAGGGIALDASASLLVRNSTLSANTATVGGGGLDVAGSTAAPLLEFTTVTQNSAAGGAGLRFGAGGAAFHATLVGDNVGGTDCASGAGSVEASGLNLDSDGSCANLASGNVATVPSLQLGPLADNGGPSRTHLPLAGSPVLDAAPECAFRSGAPVAIDQRGDPRPTEDDGDGTPACDLGAVERGPIFLDGFESGDPGRWSATVP